MEIAVSRITVSGIDARFEDHAVTPPLMVPLTGLDFELRDFTTKAFTEPRLMRFNALLTSGTVPLPARRNAVAMAEAPAVPTTAGTQAATLPAGMELRPLFSQATATGRLSLYPAPKGWVKASISGLELAALHGEAARENVTLTAGSLDAATDLRFRGDGVVNTQSTAVFTDLSMAEPDHGFFAKIFNLPAPLDAVIGVLQDAGGSITVPVKLPLRLPGPGSTATDVPLVRRDQIVGVAIEAAGNVIATAFLNAPVKVIGALGSMVGMGGGRKAGPVLVEKISFDPGAVTLDARTQEELLAAARRLQNDDRLEMTVRHQLGAQDVALVQARANPSRADALSILGELRRRKRDLQALQADATATAQAQITAGADASSVQATLTHVTAIGKELGRTEAAIDQVCDLLRPGAQLQETRRTRAAAVALANERLHQISDLLHSVLSADAWLRVQIPPPKFEVRPEVSPATGQSDAGGGTATVTLVRSAKHSKTPGGRGE